MSDDAAPAPPSEKRRPALSPSRASDFKQCPLLYRFRAIDRLPEPPSTAQVRGSVVHAALEQLYALPAPDRVPETAMSLVEPAWDRVVAAQPDLADDIEPAVRAELLEEARALLSGYYRLEDPTRFDPESCEQRVEVELADGTLLRGFVDRIDVAPTGEVRVVDYKTGKAPSEARALAEFKAMFQMKFYAVALLRSRGVLPARLRLLYLADGQVLDYSPDLDELERFEKTLIAIWRAIQSAGATGDFRPHPSRLCDWCAHHAHCPVFGGTPPPYPGWPEPRPRARRRGALLLGACCVIECHYRRLGADGEFQVFESTDYTRSNWDPEIQHGSPPLALMTKLIEELEAGRLPVAHRQGVDGHPRRDSRCAGAGSGLGGTPGRRISLLAAEMIAARPGGPDRAVARATAWLLATSDTADVATDRYPPSSKATRIRCRTAGRARRVTWRRSAGAGRPPTRAPRWSG